MNKDISITRKDERKIVDLFPGVTRRTMSYNDQSMLCVMTLSEGAIVPLHSHQASQNGYVVKGRVRFTKVVTNEKQEFVVNKGDGYLFDSNQEHCAESLEYSELIECFTPMREDYVDD